VDELEELHLASRTNLMQANWGLIETKILRKFFFKKKEKKIFFFDILPEMPRGDCCGDFGLGAFAGGSDGRVPVEDEKASGATFLLGLFGVRKLRIDIDPAVQQTPDADKIKLW
jgi:hypothetical protein